MAEGSLCPCLFLDVPYDEILPDHAFDHKHGEATTRCQDEGVITQADCKSACSAYEWCVGYNYYLGRSSPGCYLITSKGSCESGKAQIEHNGRVPDSAWELASASLSNWTCQAKSGNNT